jgi:hypothetical protein
MRPVPRRRRAVRSTLAEARVNFGRETVAAAELGPDKVAVFAEGFAHRGDLNFQVLLRDSDARPDAAHELVFSNQRSVGLQQDQEEIEGARPQLYWDAVGEQLPLPQLQTKTPEFECRVSYRQARPIPGHRQIMATHQLPLALHHLSPEGVEQRVEANAAV